MSAPAATDRAWRRFLPGLSTLTRYQRSWLSGDLIAGVAVAAYLVPQVMAYAEIASLLALTVGVMCVLGWLGRLGFLAGLISRPVLVGYMSGIAVLMIISQTFGVSPDSAHA